MRVSANAQTRAAICKGRDAGFEGDCSEIVQGPPIETMWGSRSLIRLLVAGDLAYAGIVEKPSVEEMGSLISVVSKGAVSGLNLLGLLPDKKTKHSKYPPTQVVNAFKLLFDRLKEALDAVEWNDMGLDTIVLEHSLCKLKRMKGPLGLLPKC